MNTNKSKVSKVTIKALVEFADYIQKNKNEGLNYDYVQREVKSFLETKGIEHSINLP